MDLKLYKKWTISQVQTWVEVQMFAWAMIKGEEDDARFRIEFISVNRKINKIARRQLDMKITRRQPDKKIARRQTDVLKNSKVKIGDLNLILQVDEESQMGRIQKRQVQQAWWEMQCDILDDHTPGYYLKMG